MTTLIRRGTVTSPNRAVDHFTAAPTAPVRALDTVYQNTNTTALMVYVDLTSNAASPHRYTPKVGAASPPTVAVGSEMANASALKARYAFIVPPGFYYELDLTTANVNAATINSWVEQVL